MLFLKIMATLTWLTVLGVAYWALFYSQKPRKMKQSQTTVIIGSLVVINSRDFYSRETEYQLAGTPQGTKAPTVVLHCSYDGDTDIRFGMTPGQAPVGNLAAHKLALLEQALPDIKGRLVDKKA